MPAKLFENEMGLELDLKHQQATSIQFLAAEQIIIVAMRVQWDSD